MSAGKHEDAVQHALCFLLLQLPKNIVKLFYILNETTAPAIYRLGVKVFDVPGDLDTLEGAKRTIDAVSHFCFDTLGLEATLTKLQIDDAHFDEMAEHACMGGVITGPMKLYPDDVRKIYEMCL